MKTSDSIAELATALAQAQAHFGAVKRTGRNPMFKSSYATFDDIIGAVRGPLSDEGLSYVQLIETVDGVPTLTTALMHKTGQWVESTVSLILSGGNRGTSEVQVFGSALTYMKRYALSSMLGVASDEDEDGVEKTPQPAQKQTARKPVQNPAPADADAGLPGTPAISDVPVEARPRWTSVEAAIAWAIAQGAFGDPADSGTAPHARNAYNKLRGEIDPDNAAQMFDAWYVDVLRRMQA